MKRKFRIYDKDENYMLYTEDNLVITFYEDVINVEDHTTFSSSCLVDIVNFEVMQNTGFTDIKNKEVYEGDIVKIDIDQLNSNGEPVLYETIKGVVKFKLGGFFVGDFPLSYLTLEIYPTLTSIEILGNIYENKDILKKLNKKG